MTLNWIKASKQLNIKGLILLALAVFSFTQPVFSQEGIIDTALVIQGKELFKGNCAACHNAKKDMTGPKLEGVSAKWATEVGDFEGKSSEEWLYDWIRNWKTPVDAGVPYAVEMQNYDPSVMQTNLGLADEEIKAILYYVDNSEALNKQTVVVDNLDAEDPTSNINWLLGFLIVALLIAALALAKITKTLNRAAVSKSGVAETEGKPFFKSGFFKTLVTVIIAALVIYLLASQAISLGRQQGYQPMQPIKYSHALHAGEYAIDCKYCHTAAVEGKHSNIPSTNVCMNCHKMIQSGPKHGRKEIAKIYAAIGYNPLQGTYFDKENTSAKEVEEVFTKFIDQDKDNKEIKAATAQDYKNVIEMYDKPIEWVRIHNLPDHVYFNHAQHVNVGKVECQTCHGNIQDMEVVEQHSPLSMGWCINCHRNTEVDLGNEYYKDFDKLQKMKELHNSVTVEDIGGTECQKCHY
ncbi:MAG: cytochrome c3 family protein [Chitinophagales bacterium]|mgnify:CR=1 FL=1